MNASWLQIFASHPHLLNVGLSDTYEGKYVHIDLTPQLVDTLEWVQQHRQQLERQQQIRNMDPAARELFDQYETYINLTYNK